MSENIVISIVTVAGSVLVALTQTVNMRNKKILKILDDLDKRVKENNTELSTLKKSSLQSTIFLLVEKAEREKRISKNNLSELYKAYDEYKSNGWNSHTTVRVKKFETELENGVIAIEKCE